MVYIFLIAAVVAVDQALKYAVVHNLGMLNSVSVIDNFFYIHCIPNDGIAMGMMSGRQPVIIALTSLIMVGLCAFIIVCRKRLHPFLLSCVALIVGGGIGNIIDRVRLGYVVDFFEFTFFDWPVFNVAVIYVVAGVILMELLIVFVLKDEDLDLKKKKEE